MPSKIYISGRIFAVCGVLFLVAAVTVAIINARTPFAHGWWLVAYLALGGGVAQLLLGPGLIAIAARGGATKAVLRYSVGEIVLWNIGTVIVAVADLSAAPGGVLVGSVLLLVALALFTRDLQRVSSESQPSVRAWRSMYAVLLVFLAVSTAIGTVLAYKA